MKDKQIEEMATKMLIEVNRANNEISFKNLATSLYNAGYLKQIEGRWKGAGLGDYYCSRCCATYSGGDVYNYCPNCGAKMKCESEGEK